MAGKKFAPEQDGPAAAGAAAAHAIEDIGVEESAQSRLSAARHQFHCGPAAQERRRRSRGIRQGHGRL